MFGCRVRGKIAAEHATDLRLPLFRCPHLALTCVSQYVVVSLKRDLQTLKHHDANPRKPHGSHIGGANGSCSNCADENASVREAVLKPVPICGQVESDRRFDLLRCGDSLLNLPVFRTYLCNTGSICPLDENEGEISG